jgi:hypothetical protein
MVVSESINQIGTLSHSLFQVIPLACTLGYFLDGQSKKKLGRRVAQPKAILEDSPSFPEPGKPLSSRT